MNNSTLHEAIISHFIDRQRAPSVREIAARFRCEEVDARKGLRDLADYHGVVLHPLSDEVWIAHPFSAAPTTCIVASGGRKWWGNCAWCSLGLVHLVGGTATVETRPGAIEDAVTIRFEHGELLDRGYVVHFPVPMRRAWDNVVYTCSIQLLFRDEVQVDEWCRLRGIPKGDVRPLQQIWEFAKEWYGRHADPNWTKWSLQDAAEIFARHGLTGPTWALEDNGGRF